MSHVPMTRIARHTGANAVRKNDYVTVEQCLKLADSIARQVVAQAIEDHERTKREARWYRRLLAWLRRPGFL